MQQAEAKGINITWERQQRLERQQPQSAANTTSPQPNLPLLTQVAEVLKQLNDVTQDLANQIIESTKKSGKSAHASSYSN